MHYSLITSNDELADACSALCRYETLSIDTEFKRETTYFPLPCLLQIAGAETTVCIDPFKITDFTSLQLLLSNNNVVKIMHAGRQDMEVFHKLIGSIPSPVFDTQIAAALLGNTSQIGYSALVKQFFAIDLDKSLTRTDWEKRPLSDLELNYAANDVKYLESIYHSQRKQLIEKNRMHWLMEETDRLFHDNSYEDSLEKVWRKLNQSIKLNQKQRNILYSLNQWREQEALTRNRARQFVISNEVLINIAMICPENLNQLKLVDKITAPVIGRYSDMLLHLINSDTSQQIEVIEAETFTSLSASQKQLLKDLKTEVQIVSKELEIEDSFLCNKSMLEKLVRGDKENRLFNGWRYEILGKRLEKIIC